jgi:hypothetical protein
MEAGAAVVGFLSLDFACDCVPEADVWEDAGLPCDGWRLKLLGPGDVGGERGLSSSSAIDTRRMGALPLSLLPAMSNGCGW